MLEVAAVVVLDRMTPLVRRRPIRLIPAFGKAVPSEAPVGFDLRGAAHVLERATALGRQPPVNRERVECSQRRGPARIDLVRGKLGGVCEVDQPV